MATYYIDTYRVDKTAGTTTLDRYMVRAKSVSSACNKAWHHMTKHHPHTANSTDSRCNLDNGAISHYPLVTINHKHDMVGTPHSYTYPTH